MKIHENGSDSYSRIEDTLAEDFDSNAIDMIGGMECDEEDLQAQRDNGEEDPILIIEILAHWEPEAKVGILDWFYVCESGDDEDEPDLQHGGPIVAFEYEGRDPDFDALLSAAAPILNDELNWVEFTLEDLDDLDDEEDEEEKEKESNS